MDPREQAFREFTRYFGKPMTPDDYEAAYVRVGSSMSRAGDIVQLPVRMMSDIASVFDNERNCLGMKFDSFCGLNSHMSINALVGLNRHIFCVAIYEGLLASIYEVSYWLLGDPGFMPDVGDVNLVRRSFADRLADQAKGVGHIWEQRVASGQETFSDDLFLIACPVRSEAAKQLVYEMVKFVVFHELAHIVLGHAVYLQRSHGLAHIAETDTGAQTALPESTVANRIFEYEADFNAFKKVLTVGIYASADLSREPFVARLRAVASFLVLGLFFKEWERSGSRVTLHPEPLKRMYALKRRLDRHPGLSDERSGGSSAALDDDLESISRSLNMPEFAQNWKIADKSWGREFEQEHQMAARYVREALPFGFVRAISVPVSAT